MDTLIKGDIAVAKVIFELTKNKFIVFKALSEYLPYDLVTTKDHNIFYKIQVKYISLNKNGILEIPLRTTHTNSSGAISKKVDLSKIDYFIVYCPETDNIYSIPVVEITTMTVFTIRLEKPKNNQVKGVRLALDYEGLNRIKQT